MAVATTTDQSGFLWIQPQNTGPNVDDLQSRIAKILSDSKGRCAAFISNLIDGTATERNPREFTDVLDGFALVKGQGNFIYGDTIRKAYNVDGATGRGSISGRDAQVELPYPLRGNNPTNNRAIAESQAGIQAMAVIHELIHLAGRKGYDDFELASTVAAMKGIRPPDYTGMSYSKAVLTASNYWNRALEAACKPR